MGFYIALVINQNNKLPDFSFSNKRKKSIALSVGRNFKLHYYPINL